jgi:hypothetical protein
MNRYALVDNSTRLVVGLVIGDSLQFLPPHNHIVIENAQGTIGDYWDEATDAFYAPSMKRRLILKGNLTEVVLSEEEKNAVASKLEAIFGDKHVSTE